MILVIQVKKMLQWGIFCHSCFVIYNNQKYSASVTSDWRNAQSGVGRYRTRDLGTTGEVCSPEQKSRSFASCEKLVFTTRLRWRPQSTNSEKKISLTLNERYSPVFRGGCQCDAVPRARVARGVTGFVLWELSQALCC